MNRYWSAPYNGGMVDHIQCALIEEANLRPDTQHSDEVICSDCGYNFGSYPQGMETVRQRPPCPRCGGYGRTVRKALSGSVTPLGSLNYDGFPPGPKSNRRRFAWGFTGWEMSVSLGRLVHKITHFDRRADRRYEHVEDPLTGEVLRHQDHPLTEHVGHGSAKFKPSGDEPGGRKSGGSAGGQRG
jgi:hypothetical protein